MNRHSSALLLAFLTAPALAGGAVQGSHPFSAKDLVMMDRVGDPQLSPNGGEVAFTVRGTDLKDNKGVTGVWVLDLEKTSAKPRKLAEKGSSPQWSADGKGLYFLSAASGSSQIWKVSASGGKPGEVTHFPLDVNNFKLSPDGGRALASIDVFTDCDTLACSEQRLDARKKDPATGRVYDRLFVRHWDTWADGRRSQLFAVNLGNPKSEPTLLSRNIDGDIPSKPFGDASEYTWSPDGKTVYFDVRIAGKSEPWSTNFDIYKVPADASQVPENLTGANKAWDAYPLISHDGRTLYYLAMKTPGFEADRFAIKAMDLADGTIREVDPSWDRSPGPLKLSADGKTLYTSADDEGSHRLFVVSIGNGEVSALSGDGTVTGFDNADGQVVFARQDFKHPTDLYAVAKGTPRQVTHFNADRLTDIAFGDAEWFRFPGWNDESVQGYVIKPANFQPGRKYPVAFLIHGGPQGAWSDDFHYRWNPEVYAGAGFAVVAINFHGSTGYGQAFTNAISEHWGDRPLEDLKKGWAAALDKYSFLDGNDACALGASYGGYMVYWIAGVWNQPWKCLVDHDGVFDTRMMYYATEELWFEEKENGGPQYQHPENYEKFNPLDHVADWRVPMLIIHSEHDYRIPETQGIGAFTALQRRGIPSKFLYFPDESHWVNKPANSLMWHKTVLDWMRHWTGPQMQGAAAATSG